MITYTIGLDSTDSAIGGCTTWTAINLVNFLESHGCIIGSPRIYLIRLNPNVPDKTRGNAAVKIIFKSKHTLQEIQELALKIVERDYKRYHDNGDKQPGLAIMKGEKTSNLYQKALHEYIMVDEAIRMQYADFIWPVGSKGLIGALAALSSKFYDFTYELISYRLEKKFGSVRKVSMDEVISLAREYDSTFSSIHKNRVLLAPTGPDPVLIGIRGDNASDLKQFLYHLTLEPIASTHLFITNQGTNAHVFPHHSELILYHVISTAIVIIISPEVHKGGHVKMGIRINGSDITAMVFEPTKSLAISAMKLLAGDEIFIHGAVNENEIERYISLEYFEIISLVEYDYRPPVCPTCDRSTTSSGYLQGYKCRKCSYSTYIPIKRKITRELYQGQKVYASISAQRHLTRPLKRLHRKQAQ